MILIFISYFLIGGIAALLKLISINDYLIWGGIVGGVASVIGLLSFFQPALTRDDLQQLQLDSLRSLAETTDQLEQLEQARAAARHDIDTLALQKQQMEILVRKASLSLFLQEQHDLYAKKIIGEIERNSDLATNLRELKDIDAKLAALNEEIDTDENVNLLKEIIFEAKRRQETNSILTVEFEYSPFLRFILELAQMLSNLAYKMVNTFFRPLY